VKWWQEKLGDSTGLFPSFYFSKLFSRGLFEQKTTFLKFFCGLILVELRVEVCCQLACHKAEPAA